MCQSQNVGSYEEAGEVSCMELQKGREESRKLLRLVTDAPASGGDHVKIS